ncbi:MAG: plastocyanin/azurin family copper-binding protein [Chitinophagales bacterium]|nr:plastocyanin/azurin family copper-binding protein [Chitinophagales bacterium]
MKLYIFFLSSLLLLGNLMAQEQERILPGEEDYYKIITLPIPQNIVLEVGGMLTLPNGNIAVSTRRGEVWIVDNPYMAGAGNPHYRLFASGLHEILGLAYRDGSFYLAQRGELTRLEDTNGDGRADVYETVYAWPLSGHYHEYSFGPVIAADGNMYVTANVAFGDKEWWRGESRVPWRGWTMKITPDGLMEPYATGMRSPCGIGMVDGAFFYADNQGDWMGSGGVVHVEKGDFTGHPAGLRWSGLPESPVSITTNDIYYRVNPRFTPEGKPLVKPENIENEIPQPLFELEEDLPSIKTPAVWLPHGILGVSTSEIITDLTEGAFGPFQGQLLVGDQGQSKIVRVFLEKVDGVYQGAAINFRQGFQSGVLRMCWGNDASLFVGQTSRGWGSTGNDPYGLQRLIWTGETPFEINTVSARPDGFELTFTQPVDKQSALNPESYKITSFIYKYHPVYGSPEVNQQECPVNGIKVADDGMSVRLLVDSLRLKYIHEIKAMGIASYNGNLPLLHNAAYYTLNVLPSDPSLQLEEAQKVAAMKPVEAYWKTKEEERKRAEEAMAKMHEKHNKAATIKSKEKKTKPVPKKSTRSSKRVTKMPSSWGGEAEKSIVLSTLPGMKYDQSTLSVKAGSKVKFTFYNNDDMPHNIVFTTPGGADAVGKAAMNLGLQGQAMNYVPAMKEVLHHSRLVGPGASETLFFTAPSKPGTYMYVCTFPGHYKTMRGILRVL